MGKEKIKLLERPTKKMLNVSTGKYEYYTAKQKNAGDEIVLDKDKELYDTANKVMENMKQDIATLSKIENVHDVKSYLEKNNIVMLFDTPRHRPEFVSNKNETYYQIMFESPDKILFEVVYIGLKK